MFGGRFQVTRCVVSFLLSPVALLLGSWLYPHKVSSRDTRCMRVTERESWSSIRLYISMSVKGSEMAYPPRVSIFPLLRTILTKKATSLKY